MNGLDIQRRRISPYLITAASLAIYLLFFVNFHTLTNPAIALLAILPVMSAGWYFGVSGGLAMAIMISLVSVLILGLSAPAFYTAVANPGTIVWTLLLILVAVVIGKIRSILRARDEVLIRFKDLEKEHREYTAFLEALDPTTRTTLEGRDLHSALNVLEDAQQQVKELKVLHEVALLSTQVATIDELIERTTEIIGRNLFPDNFGILLMDEQKDVLHPHPSYRFVSANDRFPTEIPLGQGIAGEVARTGKSIRIEDVDTIQNYLEVDRGTASELCVPIKFQDRVLGVINAESTKRNAFSQDDEYLLGTLASQLATAIEQLRIAQAERRWLDQLAHSNGLIYALAHISTHIEKGLTREDIIQTLGQELSKIDLTCMMAYYDENRSSFSIHYTSIPPTDLERMENSLGFPVIHHTFSLPPFHPTSESNSDFQPTTISNPGHEFERLFTHRSWKGNLEFLPEIGITPEAELLRLPLVFEEKLLGMLWLWGKGITRADLPIMSIFAKQIGISLEHARLFQEVQSLALTDPLTGLQNRRSLFELGRIEFFRSIRMNSPFCCMMLDLDHFKQINDDYGHPVGDKVLQGFAEHCKKHVREIDFLGRYGGEELIILLPETHLEEAWQVAERLRASIAETPMRVSNLELSITVSIGLARKDENTPDLETLIARADQALYIAKFRGRNCVATSK